MPDDVSALQLVLTGDPALFAIVRLSLVVSLSAVALGGLIGVPLGAAVALTPFPGREAVIVTLNALMGLPPSWSGCWSICCCRAPGRSARGACCSRRRR
jgi:tungstate transport system permease protein